MKRDSIIKLFGDKENFEYQHNQKIDFPEVEKWLDIQSFDSHDFDLEVNAAGAFPDVLGFEDTEKLLAGFRRSELGVINQKKNTVQDTTQTNSKHRIRLCDKLGDNQKRINNNDY